MAAAIASSGGGGGNSGNSGGDNNQQRAGKTMVAALVRKRPPTSDASVFLTLPVDNPGGSDFPGKHNKSKNVSSARGNPWRVTDGGQKKSPNLDSKTSCLWTNPKGLSIGGQKSIIPSYLVTYDSV
jgi:hypothetical protein